MTTNGNWLNKFVVMDLISIIVPVYNAGAYLRRCLESLLEQSYSEWEAICVNDGSTDDNMTLYKLQSIENECTDSVIVVDLSENVGLGEARNVGLKFASGEYVQFLDADDELSLDACAILYSTAKKYRSDLIQFNHLYILGNEKKSSNNSTENKHYFIRNKAERITFLSATRVTYGCTNKFYRTEFIRRVNSHFPSRVRYEEPLFVYPLFLYAENVTLLNESLYYYKFRGESIVTSELGKKLLDHPKVQLMLLQDCIGRNEIYEEYKDIIGVYFLWTFYCETISFCENYEDAGIPFDYFKEMQTVCRSFFGDWRSNPYLGLIPKDGIRILESVDMEFNSQGEVDEFIGKMGGLI